MSTDADRRSRGGLRAAGRGQGRLVVAHHRGRRHRSGPGPPPHRGAGRPPARTGAELVLVSSGAIAAGLAPLGMSRRPRGLAAQQAAASVGQGLLVHRYTEELARHGVVAGQVLLTNDDMTRRSHYRNAYQTFAKLLDLGVLPIVNENDTVATSEIRFGDNDRAGAGRGVRRVPGAVDSRRQPHQSHAVAYLERGRPLGRLGAREPRGLALGSEGGDRARASRSIPSTTCTCCSMPRRTTARGRSRCAPGRTTRSSPATRSTRC